MKRWYVSTARGIGMYKMSVQILYLYKIFSSQPK